MPPETLGEVLTAIKVDIAGIRSDVKWLTRGFMGMLVIVGAMAGLDLTGMV